MRDGERDDEADRSGDGAEDEGEEREDSHLDTSETSGLGLTEEFERIEAEIEETFDTGEHPERGEATEPQAPAGEPGRSDTADDWISEEEQAAEGHYGETGEYDAVPETGEWTAEHAAVPPPPDDDEDLNSAEFPVVRPHTADSEEHEAIEPAGSEAAEPEDVAGVAGDLAADAPQPPAEPSEHEAVATGDAEPPSPGAPAAEPDGSDAETVVQRPEDGAEAPIAAAATPPAASDDAVTEVRPAPPVPAAAGSGGGKLTPIPPSPSYSGPPAISDEELDLKVPSLWLRFLSGSVMIVMSVAAAVAVSGLLFLGDVAAKLNPIPGIDDQLEEVESDDPQTVLIIGSDRRSSDPKGVGARSDTTMLLRVDPDKKVLSLFSLPRDLKVNIPGYGVSKLNDAYTVGGAEKTLATVADYTGLDINHVVEINFEGFADAVNAIDCVYVDVDRDYFNDNSTALSAAETYAAIDINAGYQRLCGEKALQYVRYRHTDTDLVRAARQQDFLRAAKDQISTSRVIDDLERLGKITAKATQTDKGLRTKRGFLSVAKLALQSADHPVRQLDFPATFAKETVGEQELDYVQTDPAAVAEVVDRFLRGGGEEARTALKKKSKAERRRRGSVREANLVPARDAAEKLVRDTGRRGTTKSAGLPIRFPSHLPPNARYDGPLRLYGLRARNGDLYRAYRFVLVHNRTDGQFYGVQGTTWRNPPLLAHPSAQRKVKGRTLELFRSGSRLRFVAWRTTRATYWISNTLNLKLTDAEMLALAANLTTTRR